MKDVRYTVRVVNADYVSGLIEDFSIAQKIAWDLVSEGITTNIRVEKLVRHGLSNAFRRVAWKSYNYVEGEGFVETYREREEKNY